jgi:hypothetical protein
MNTEISPEDFAQIEKTISSDESVVGIDARKTHIIIIHMLNEIMKSLNNLENRVSEIEKKLT